jgi:hypothetical protein
LKLRFLLVLVLMFSAQHSGYASSCVEPVMFENTPQYEIFKSIESVSESEEETLQKFAERGELGKALLELEEFRPGYSKENIQKLRNLLAQWERGEGVFVQQLLLLALISEPGDLNWLGARIVLEDFLRRNRKYCWVGQNESIVLLIQFKLALAKALPRLPSLQSYRKFARALILDAYEADFLIDYMKLVKRDDFEALQKEHRLLAQSIYLEGKCRSKSECLDSIVLSLQNYLSRHAQTAVHVFEKSKCNLVYLTEKKYPLILNICDD